MHGLTLSIDKMKVLAGVRAGVRLSASDDFDCIKNNIIIIIMIR